MDTYSSCFNSFSSIHAYDNIAGRGVREEFENVAHKKILFLEIIWISDFIYIYTGCNRRYGPDFGRVFLRPNYTDITQNTYIQSWTVTEILTREKSGLLWCLHTALCPWRYTPSYCICIPMILLDAVPATLATGQRIVVGSQWTTMIRVRVFL